MNQPTPEQAAEYAKHVVSGEKPKSYSQWAKDIADAAFPAEGDKELKFAVAVAGAVEMAAQEGITRDRMNEIAAAVIEESWFA